MPQTSVPQRIRGGLRFLARADKAVIRAAAPLERLEGEDPAGASDLLEAVTLDVGGRRYVGMMTQGQYEYLQGYTGSPVQFADAIARVLVKMNGKVVDILTDLSRAFDVPATRGAVGPVGSIDPPPTGCCTFDTNQQKDGITKSFCVGGLQGQWSPNPCVGRTRGGQSRTRRAGSAR
jgi:hypothetical protein